MKQVKLPKLRAKRSSYTTKSTPVKAETEDTRPEVKLQGMPRDVKAVTRSNHRITKPGSENGCGANQLEQPGENQRMNSKKIRGSGLPKTTTSRQKRPAKRTQCPRNLQWLSAVPLRLGTAAGGTLAPCVHLNPNLIYTIIINCVYIYICMYISSYSS